MPPLDGVDDLCVDDDRLRELGTPHDAMADGDDAGVAQAGATFLERCQPPRAPYHRARTDDVEVPGRSDGATALAASSTA